MKLKATDLMVGDWVQFHNESTDKDECARVTAISDGKFVQTSDCDVYYQEEIYRPIELTTDILIKNGAEKSNNDRLYFVNKLWEYDELLNRWKIGRMNDAYDIPQFDSFLSIGFVHEFQHFLKLIRVDKEVEI